MRIVLLCMRILAFVVLCVQNKHMHCFDTLCEECEMHVCTSFKRLRINWSGNMPQMSSSCHWHCNFLCRKKFSRCKQKSNFSQSCWMNLLERKWQTWGNEYTSFHLNILILNPTFDVSFWIFVLKLIGVQVNGCSRFIGVRDLLKCDQVSLFGCDVYFWCCHL